MSEANEPQGRVAAARDWAVAHPGEAATLGTVAALIVLGAVAIFVPAATPFLLASFAAVVSALAILVLVDRKSIRDISTGVGEIDAAVGRVEQIAGALLADTKIREIAADTVNSELHSLLSGASEWRFRGGSARWQRSDVFPALAKITDRDVPYQALVLSPFDRDLCDRYADYRRRSRESEQVDGEDVRRDILAFVYAAAVWARDSRIVPEISLLGTYSPLRVDGSADALLVTVADKTRSALRADAAGWYFLSLKDEFRLHGQSSPLSLPTAVPRNLSRNATAVQTFFASLLTQNEGLDRSALDDLDQSDWEDISHRALPSLSAQ